ncbi:hypothetical protein ACFWH7_14590 [Cellulosimicrobium cellulans]|uniref:hypothetical protein n=1 Tax=Cellulosimicrobium cellulans TaxID=1710 RepID=UPI0036607B73
MSAPHDASPGQPPVEDPTGRFRPPARNRARRAGAGSWPGYAPAEESAPDPLDRTLSRDQLRRAADRKAPRVRDRRRSSGAAPRASARPSASAPGGGRRRPPERGAGTWRTPTRTRSGRERHVLSPVRYRSAGLAFVTGLGLGAAVAVPGAVLLAVAGVDGEASPWGWLAAAAALGSVVGLCVPLLRLRWTSAPWGSTTPPTVRWLAWAGGASLALMVVLVRWAALS